jgi:hypothetical protein
MKKQREKVLVGIAWYRPEQYWALKDFCDDRDTMDPTYEIWRRGAENVMRDLRTNGETVEPVDFDLEEFKIWCSANGKRPIATSRSEFASVKLRDAHEG